MEPTGHWELRLASCMPELPSCFLSWSTPFIDSLAQLLALLPCSCFGPCIHSV